ncbi:pyridoxamine 5'-phosphate oxidase family protein [Nocardia cyriacigeorgica]|uniref:Pyridoxamine 5'-phosphate oxidase family protein n=1 Tax=Nocardia cyriacigeorgica TaxID=135487 RepID=A0A6P1DC20_9NOCA|nr:pyridoxamine 5'-phosphate oxidase family protein [Nocardia cyriacigeorgica]NEW42714.1 pyridoxamine 5'-phosphate oxidase family protein [Nocardia cyriacigeorgica]NEW48296.1 pyridoxamine 5'-phosphate oxidase family protein [Nocardia cyriacigeorgica]NEW53907.1 pyridoxamine 5'-phosphate oxidase family protein [Nocardia cyriacigeorgica]NEW58948.1 pyridoxamine 5'-phosphate oxidase family protein [Nocardia cyriacigeorgica]
MSNDPEITDSTELRELLGAVMPRAVSKERVSLHPRDREWIACSPFLVMCTSDGDGNCDASPKGDPAGFVKVLDDTTIAIPERPGNRRADGYLNILANPHVGLLFMIPGRRETLRINGRARLIRDAPYFEDMVVRGHRPILAVEVGIEQIFFHCAKAFMRSHLWEPDNWPLDTLPSPARLIKEVQTNITESVEDLETYYSAATYERKLYNDSPT